MPLRDYLRPLRADAIFVQNDDEVRQIAAFFEVEIPPTRPDANCRFIGSGDHPSHWLVIGQFWGFNNTVDNGMSAWFIPKQLHPSPVEAERAFIEMLPPGFFYEHSGPLFCAARPPNN